MKKSHNIFFLLPFDLSLIFLPDKCDSIENLLGLCSDEGTVVIEVEPRSPNSNSYIWVLECPDCNSFWSGRES